MSKRTEALAERLNDLFEEVLEGAGLMTDDAQMALHRFKQLAMDTLEELSDAEDE